MVRPVHHQLQEERVNTPRKEAHVRGESSDKRCLPLDYRLTATLPQRLIEMITARRGGAENLV